MDDRGLIELYLRRDETAIAETDAKYGRLCFQLAYAVLRNRSDAEECVSDAYLSVWNSIPPTRPANFKAFLCKITRNLALKEYAFNHAAKRRADLDLSLFELEAILPDTSYQPGLGDESLGRQISDFLRGEKEDARNVFIRKYWFFDTVEEIASRYSFTESKVKSMLRRTRGRLKEFLLKEDVQE